jgi:uncharacterized protein YdeI (YjbR/CyaY-like superfamily)
MKNTSPDVDRYIAKAAPFAQPILEKIRKGFHKANPNIVETIKWSVPHFEYKGPLAGMAAFKQHVRFGFWKASLMDDPHGIAGDTPAGKHFASVNDLPSEKVLVEYVRQAIALNEKGEKVARAPREKRDEADVPADLAAALKKSPKAKKAFDAFSPSHRREYVEWITEAKQEATRQKRLAQAIEWIGEGKSRNWKYMPKK